MARTGAPLVCSDGLWNDLPEPADLADLALPKALNDPLGATVDMVQFAVAAGRGDNVTVVLISYPAPQVS
jgi:serine/threonine protein phosphatase PrpC